MKRIINSGEHFTTFNYNGKDSADFGITSITNGGKYQISFEPDFSDSTQSVPGYDGLYYYGTQIPSQGFSFSCFAHDLTINEYDALRSWLNPRGGGRLILADQPYKYYLVKPESVTKLDAIPMSSVSTINYFGANDRTLEETVYTGNFTVSFRTVGSSYGIGLSYYMDDLLYDTGLYYDSGLLYKDMSPSLTYAIGSNAEDAVLTLYNPGTAHNRPVFTFSLGSTELTNPSFIKIKNESTGTICYVDVSNFKDTVIVNFENQTVTYNNKIYYGRIFGQVLEVSPKQNLILIPETNDVAISSTEYETYNTIYIDNNVAYINPLFMTVSSDLVGRYLCINNNGGAKIMSVDVEHNSLTLDSTIKGGVGTYNIPQAVGETPAGFPCTYLEVNNVMPGSGTLGQVIVVNNVWYIWMYGAWIKTSLFSAKSDFYNEEEEYETKYVLFGATILNLDNITVTTGNKVSFNRGSETVTGSSIGAISCSVSITPKYL